MATALSKAQRIATMARVLAHLSAGETIKGAAAIAGTTARSVFNWRRNHPLFTKHLESALHRARHRRRFLAWLRHYRRGLRPPAGIYDPSITPKFRPPSKRQARRLGIRRA